MRYGVGLGDDRDAIHSQALNITEQAKVARRDALHVQAKLGMPSPASMTSPRSTEESVASAVAEVTRTANADLVTIQKWDLMGVTAATQQVPIEKTQHQTPSGLWVTTLKVSGRYTSLVRFVSFASSLNRGGAALSQLHVIDHNFDMLIDVFGTCKGCIDAVR